MAIGRVPGATGIQPSIVDAKGDLIVATAADSVDRLAVGTNGQVLKADSSTATGLAWGADGSAAFSGVALFNSTNVSISNNTDTVMTWDSESYDTDGFHSTTTNTDRITAPSGKAGYYTINCILQYSANATGQRFVQVFKNNSYVAATSYQTTASGQIWQQVSATVYLAVGDYLTIKGYQNSGSTLNMLGGSALYSVCYVQYLGA